MNLFLKILLRTRIKIKTFMAFYIIADILVSRRAHIIPRRDSTSFQLIVLV